MAGSGLIPPCILLLQLAATETNKISTLFEQKSSNFKALKATIQNGRAFSSDVFLQSTEQVTYIQMLLLVGLSMHGGIFVPTLRDCLLEND